jgi:hypothetical protein
MNRHLPLRSRSHTRNPENELQVMSWCNKYFSYIGMASYISSGPLVTSFKNRRHLRRQAQWWQLVEVSLSC